MTTVWVWIGKTLSGTDYEAEYDPSNDQHTGFFRRCSAVTKT